MIVLLQVIVATAVIAALIVLRTYTHRRVLQHRAGCSGSGRSKDCAGGCGGIKAAVESGLDPRELN